MADETIALEIFIEADKANLSLGELQAGFEAINEELKNTEKGTERFNELSTAMVNTSKEVKNLEASFEGLDNQQLADEFTTLAGGIADVTAAFILMGGESETIDELAGSIQTAMAVSMGFKGAIDGVSSGMKIYNDLAKSGKIATIAKAVVEKGAAAATWLMTKAQTALNVIMSLNPIALVVIAIAALVAGFVLLGKNIGKVIDFYLLPLTLVIDGVKAALRSLGLMEESTAEQTKKAEEEKEKATRDSVNKRLDELKKLETASRNLTDNLVADKDWEIKKLKAAGKDTTKLEREKLVILQKSYIEQKRLQQERLLLIDEEIKRNGLLKSVLNGDAVEKFMINEQLKKSDEDLFESSRALEIFDIEVKTSNSAKRTAINKKEADEKKKIDEKAAADAAELIRTLDDLEAKAFEDKNLRALAELELAQTREREALILKHGENAELLAALDAAQLVQTNALDDSIEQEAIDKEAERVAAAKAIKDEADAIKEANDITAAAKKQARRDKDFANARATIGALSALNKAATDTALLNAAGNEEKKEKIRKASFEREKKLNIAMALINGAQAVLVGFVNGGLPMAIVAGVTAAAQLAAIVATTYQSTGGAVATPTESPVSPDGAGSGGGGAQINPVTNTSTILGNQQVTVTETDITSTQNNVSVIEESATF